jgi:hypothetical protein
MTMKYFLASFLISTVSLAAPPAAVKGVTLGTLEMWSDWLPAVHELSLEKGCLNVARAYNELNEPRGYWGRLIKNEPVRVAFRRVSGGGLEQKLFCHLRVYKAVQEEPVN